MFERLNEILRKGDMPQRLSMARGIIESAMLSALWMLIMMALIKYIWGLD